MQENEYTGYDPTPQQYIDTFPDPAVFQSFLRDLLKNHVRDARIYHYNPGNHEQLLRVYRARCFAKKNALPLSTSELSYNPSPREIGRGNRQNQSVFYSPEDGQTKIDVRLENETVWLTQKSMTKLFQVKPQNITMHLKNIYQEGELAEKSTWNRNRAASLLYTLDSPYFSTHYTRHASTVYTHRFHMIYLVLQK